MTKSELIDSLARRAFITKKEADRTTKILFEIIIETILLGEEVKITGFGKSYTKDVAEKMGINPKTKEKIMIPKSRKLIFKAGRSIKEKLKE